jgi:NAD(P)-dependent dehydrogenase (short-subunit alcohol dehydrogenase family)
MFSLKNKVIVISGASSGIGRQCAISCSKQGAKIILLARNKINLTDTLDNLTGGNHLIFALDIQDSIEIENSIKQAISQLGLIDGFIHCAGIQNTLPLRLHTPEIYNNQFSINAVAGFETCRIISKPEYINPTGASFILISSIRGILGISNQVGYSASKGAVISGVRSIAIELAKKNIRVNSISPGIVEDTKMTNSIIKHLSQEWSEKNKIEYPLGWINTSDIANACIYLLSDEASKITGINLVIDGGYSAK